MNDELSKRELEAYRFIRNRLVHGLESPSIREVGEHLGYRSPRSAHLIINKLIKNKLLSRKKNDDLQLTRDLISKTHNKSTIQIPIVGSVACGSPLLAEENIEAFVDVDTQIAKPGNKYFILRAQGDSMNKAGIDDGDLVLVRETQTADDKEIVVALIDDEATLKRYYKKGSHVVLQPESKNPAHKPIILTEDFQIQGVWVATLPDIN